LLAAARKRFEAAHRARSERMARKALTEISSAFNWLEDTAYEERAHKLLHAAGRWTREHFGPGCKLTWTGTTYEHRCPVNVTHLRLGFSPALVVRQKVCVLCGADSSECAHLADREYLVPGGPGPLGRCRVCSLESCRHSADRTYWARPSAIGQGIDEMTEVSIVARPVQPDARVRGRPVDQATLEESLGPTFTFGKDTIWCSQCLEPCGGFQRLDDDPRREVERAKP
jgi:hypothetical protein